MRGRLTITMTQSTIAPDCISIQIADYVERGKMIRVEVSPEDFANALFGRIDRNCDIVRNTMGTEE